MVEPARPVARAFVIAGRVRYNIDMKTVEKLRVEIETAIENLDEINARFTTFLGKGQRDLDGALLFSRYVELYYNRLETVFLHVKAAFGNDVESTQWHKTLLSAMAKDTPYRKRLIGDAAFHALDELRGFRHFVRYNYRLDNYDWDRIRVITEMYEKSYTNVVADFRAFIEYLDALSSQDDTDG